MTVYVLTLKARRNPYEAFV